LVMKGKNIGVKKCG